MMLYTPHVAREYDSKLEFDIAGYPRPYHGQRLYRDRHGPVAAARTDRIHRHLAEDLNTYYLLDQKGTLMTLRVDSSYPHYLGT